MPWITVATPPFASLEQVDEVIAQLGGIPDGMEARYVGTTGDGELRVVSVWASKAHAERFFTEKLGPAIARTLGDAAGPSELVGIDVARTYVREPVG